MALRSGLESKMFISCNVINLFSALYYNNVPKHYTFFNISNDDSLKYLTFKEIYSDGQYCDFMHIR